jgi:phosphohistidine phosphatase
MKKLLLMRHGKSNWNKPGQEDIERPLTPRGQKAVECISTWIEEHGLRPNAVLISTAQRTQETWQLARDIFGDGANSESQEALYLASPNEVLGLLAGVDDRHETVLVIGHNPGLESLSHLLAGPSTDRAVLADLRRGFPTAALAIFELAGESWVTLNTDGARMTDFVRPRDLV